MKQHEASKLLRGFKQAFSEQTITALGRSTGFFKRERKMTPMKMMMSLLSCFGGGQSTTLADVQRSYNAVSPESMAYKPFHNQWSKAAFARFMQAFASHVLSTLVVEVVKPSRAGLLAEFGRVLIQDGSSFAVKDTLRRSYPGRFTTVSPAAVELHVTWNLCRESIEQVVHTRKPIKSHAQLPVIPFDGRPSESGGHAYALVGYNTNGFILQNSWGCEWGAGGFAVITYADWLANAMDAWAAALGVPGVVVGKAAGLGTPVVGRAGADSSRWWDEAPAYQHSIVTGNDGRVRRYLTEDESSRMLMHQAAGLPDRWFRASAGTGKKRLVIYAHGGLNSEKDAIERARAMGRFFTGNGCYPLFLVWKTGLLESIGNIFSEAARKEPPRAAGIGEWLTERSDALIEKTIGRGLARPIWSEMKENAELACSSGRGGALLAAALQKLAGTWGDEFELHLVGHSAGAIILGNLLTPLAACGLTGRIASIQLYAPACSVQFANRHYASRADLMKRLFIDVLSDRNERDDHVVTLYRKSLLYLVSNALEIDLRTPILGLVNVADPKYRGWDGSSSTGEVLGIWREAAKLAGLRERTVVVERDKILQSVKPAKTAHANHGGFDNDVETITATLKRITGGPLKTQVDDLRGF